MLGGHRALPDIETRGAFLPLRSCAVLRLIKASSGPTFTGWPEMSRHSSSVTIPQASNNSGPETIPLEVRSIWEETRERTTQTRSIQRPFPVINPRLSAG